MAKRGEHFKAEFKFKVVLELLREESSLAEISSKYNVISKSITAWKSRTINPWSGLAKKKSQTRWIYYARAENNDRKKQLLIGIVKRYSLIESLTVWINRSA